MPPMTAVATDIITPCADSAFVQVPLAPKDVDHRLEQQFQIPEVITPPIIGAAMRFITSAPLCVVGDHMMGSRPNKMAQISYLRADALHRAFDDGGVQVVH